MFFIDGTNLSLVRFDELRLDKEYALSIEEDLSDMCSCHTIKRFFNRFHYFIMTSFRYILRKLFVWRLQIEKPEIVVLLLDTIVMDNKREAVSATYEGLKVFKPLRSRHF